MEENLTHHYELRIPTEQYAYIHCNYTGTLEGAIEHYNEMKKSVVAEGKTGVSSKVFNAFLDCYLATGHAPDGGITVWEEMTTEQRMVINECKKAFARIKPKQ